MRLWTLHPKYLDPKGLSALWREGLLAQSVLKGLTKAYALHPQLVRFRRSRTPVKCIAEYLRVVHDEGIRRGYKYDSSKIARGGKVESLVVSSGQLRYEWFHLLEKVQLRNPKWFNDLVLVKRVIPNPIFKIVPGGIEDWEKISDATKPPVAACGSFGSRFLRV